MKSDGLSWCLGVRYPMRRPWVAIGSDGLAVKTEDVVVFDRQCVADRAPFTDPHQHSEGEDVIEWQADLERGKHTGVRAGRVLYGPGTRRD